MKKCFLPGNNFFLSSCRFLFRETFPLSNSSKEIGTPPLLCEIKGSKMKMKYCRNKFQSIFGFIFLKTFRYFQG